MSSRGCGKSNLADASDFSSPPCKNGGGFKKAVGILKLVSQVMVREGLCSENTDFYSPTCTSCEELQQHWRTWCSDVKRRSPKAAEYIDFRIDGYLKGTRGVFDYNCYCQGARSSAAKESWLNKMTLGSKKTPSYLLNDVKERLRRILTCKDGDYWSLWDGEKDTRYRVPNGMACLEASREKGGTFGVKEGNMVRDYGSLRIATVPTKGKIRVLTMQPALVKIHLDAPMEAAYDWISKQSWVVRGEVEADHYAPIVGDMSEDRFFISGDYSSATDNLNKDLVLSVVEVLADYLPHWEGAMLISSFRDVHVSGVSIEKGSMMGSKMSFVILSLLNRVFFDISMGVKTYRDPGFRNNARSVIINGDDSAWCGTREEFDRWCFWVSIAGFEVNRSKTRLSKRFVEVNSQPFDADKFRLLPKPSFGFLIRESSEDISFDVLVKLAHHLSWSTWTFFSTHALVVRMLKECRISVLSLESRFWRFFRKKKWFRKCLLLGSPEAETPLPMALGPVVSPEDELVVRAWEREARRDYVEAHQGRGGFVPTPKLLKKEKKEKTSYTPCKVVRSRFVEGRRLWVKPVLDGYRNFLSTLGSSSGHGMLFPFGRPLIRTINSNIRKESDWSTESWDRLKKWAPRGGFVDKGPLDDYVVMPFRNYHLFKHLDLSWTRGFYDARPVGYGPKLSGSQFVRDPHTGTLVDIGVPF